MKTHFINYYVVTEKKSKESYYKNVDLEKFDGSFENAVISCKEEFSGERIVLFFYDNNNHLTINPVYLNNKIGWVVLPDDGVDYIEVVKKDLDIINHQWKHI